MPFPNVTLMVAKDALPATATWRQDATAGSVVTFSLSSNVGVNSYQWLLWRIEGSGAGGAGTEPINLGTGATANITIDLRGTYIVWCLVNAGAPDATVIKGGAAYLESFTTLSGKALRKLGPNESDEDISDPTIKQGWIKMLNRWLGLIGGSGAPMFHARQMHSDYDPTGTNTSGASTWWTCVSISGFTVTEDTGYLLIQAVVSGKVAAKNVEVFARVTMDGGPLPTSTVGSSASYDGGPVDLAILSEVPIVAAGVHDFVLEISSSTTDVFSELYASDHTQGARLVVTEFGLDSGTAGPPGPTGPAGPAGPGSTDIASWDITKCRYIFVDPINGDDSRIGYIDAAPGSTFTAPQVLAVSVKTTHRINEIRPVVGAGRMCVVLIAKNGTAPLDHASPGDGLGQDDRHLRFGYAKLYTRGSDLTNSAADQSQMGFVTSSTYAGPGGTGEWTVATVGATALSDGTSIQLTGATFPAGVDMARYRLRAHTAGGSTFYMPVRWSAIDSDAVDTLVVWVVPGFLSPGDSIWVEEPGVILDSFQEAASYAASPATVGLASFLAGLRLATVASFGCPDDLERATCLTGVVAVDVIGTGRIEARPIYDSESGVPSLPFHFGLASQSINFNGRHIEMNFSVIAGGNQSNIFSDYISLVTTTIESSIVTGGAMHFLLYNINSGTLQLSPIGIGSAKMLRSVTAWSPNIAVAPVDGFALLSFADMHNLRLVAEGGEPDAPAITLKAGQYTVLFDHGNGGATPIPGNGVRIEYDAPGTKFTPLTWASLQTTGFEIEGLQKVLCKMTGANYHEDMLPCPRGKVMQLPDNNPS